MRVPSPSPRRGEGIVVPIVLPPPLRGGLYRNPTASTGSASRQAGPLHPWPQPCAPSGRPAQECNRFQQPVEDGHGTNSGSRASALRIRVAREEIDRLQCGERRVLLTKNLRPNSKECCFDGVYHLPVWGRLCQVFSVTPLRPLHCKRSISLPLAQIFSGGVHKFCDICRLRRK